MKGLVLAGGRGVRLHPLTRAMPKQLIPVAGRPVLFYGLAALAGAGISDVAIVIGDRGAQIRAAVGDGSGLGLRVTYLHQPEPLGLAHGVVLARSYLGEEPFIMYLGDNVVLDDGVTGLAERFGSRPADAEILVAKVADPRSYGVAELDPGGRVVALEEKSPAPKSDLALIGAYAFGPAIHAAVAAIAASDRGELEITDAIQWLIDQGRDVRAHVFDGYWRDTGRVEDLLRCNHRILDTLDSRLDGRVDSRTEVIGRVVVAEGADVRRSCLIGPLIIGAGSTVTGARIGPYTSIGSGCRVEDARVGYSIVLDGQSIVGGHPVESSVVGHGVTLSHRSQDSSARISP